MLRSRLSTLSSSCGYAVLITMMTSPSNALLILHELLIGMPKTPSRPRVIHTHPLPHPNPTQPLPPRPLSLLPSLTPTHIYKKKTHTSDGLTGRSRTSHAATFRSRPDRNRRRSRRGPSTPSFATFLLLLLYRSDSIIPPTIHARDGPDEFWKVRVGTEDELLLADLGRVDSGRTEFGRG